MRYNIKIIMGDKNWIKITYKSMFYRLLQLWKSSVNRWLLSLRVGKFYTVLLTESTRLTSNALFYCLTIYPPSVIDPNVYLCSESVKCEVWAVFIQTLLVELTLAVTLSQSHYISLDTFDISPQILGSTIRQCNCLHYNQNLALHCK